MTGDPQQWYARHGRLTDPGRHAAMLDALPDGIDALVATVQGLLIHEAGLRLYRLSGDDFAGASRETRPVSERLDALAGAPLPVAREPARRIFGTCRDCALMLAAFLRHKGTPARVRCGFAGYFRPGFHADHWVCEYWRAGNRRWALADAQLDGPHRDHLRVAFDPTDLPADAFLTAGRSWQLVQAGAADPSAFGHGNAIGEWFMRVNLARDLLALGKREVSAWDGWREAPPASHRLDDDARAWCDSVTRVTAKVDTGRAHIIANAGAVPPPFWR